MEVTQRCVLGWLVILVYSTCNSLVCFVGSARLIESKIKDHPSFTSYDADD